MAANEGNLMAVKKALDVLVEEGADNTLPETLEHIYRAFCERLNLASNYVVFRQHYSHRSLYSAYMRIDSWFKELKLPDSYPIHLRFWGLCARLIQQEILRQDEAVSLDMMVTYLYKLPNIFQQAFPAIQTPGMKERLRQYL